MIEELYKLEATLSALSVGICKNWSETLVLAHGLSGKRNKLGYAIDHLLANPNGINARLVTLILAKNLVSQKVCNHKNSWDVANDAISWWWDCKCPHCHGRGVLNIEQDMCRVCVGTGMKPKPTKKEVYRGIGVIEAALEMMESQLRHRTQGCKNIPQDYDYTIHFKSVIIDSDENA